jgi:hypothetical protein
MNIKINTINSTKTDEISKKLKTVKDLKKNLKKEINSFNREDTGQGAAEYILLFGGVIVIAIAALLIYRAYFESGSTGLDAGNDVNDVRKIMNST